MNTSTGTLQHRTLTDDLPGMIRRSRETGAVLIRVPDGWVYVPVAKYERWSYHYTDIGGWDTDINRWEVMQLTHAGYPK